MLAAHPSCSDFRERFNRPSGRWKWAAVMAACMVVSGCNNASLNVGDLGLNLTPSAERVLNGGKARVQKLASRSTPSRKPQSTAVSTFDGNVSERGSAFGTQSARCRYLEAQAGVQSSILHTPTVSSEIDDEGESNVSISYDMMDIHRARLKHDMAEARCRHHLASKKLVQMLITSSQSLTQAGYLAKANSLRSSGPRFARIKRRINSALEDGRLTDVQATILKQYITRIKSYEASAEGQAVRREAIGGIQNRDTRDVDRKLVEAQRDIERIQSQIRTADLVTVSLSGGYNQSNNDRLVSNRRDNNDVYGNVKVSMRLGAISPRRYEWEDIAEEARIDGLYERDSGLLWRSNDLARIHDKALRNLYEQKRQIQIALKEAHKNSNLQFSTLQTELVVPKLRAQIDILALNAELAGINATIADSIRLKEKLQFK